MVITVKIRNLESEFNRITSLALDDMDKQLAIQAAALRQELKDVTPVDTGLASASWVLIKREHTFSIMNSVPYINQLNNGSSKQAPAHFVEHTALKYGKPIGTIVQVTES